MKSRGGSLSNRTVELPRLDFFYTLDQIAMLVGQSERWVIERTTRVGRDLRGSNLDLLKATNISGPTERPVWRVSERELLRWLRRLGADIKVPRRGQ